jgi:glycosyltransferase involved in cell wall biosynthesis
MRFVLIGPAYPLRGAMSHFGALLADALRRRGHRVWALSFKRQYPTFLFPGKTQEDPGRELAPVDSAALLDSIGPLSWIKSIGWINSKHPDCVIFNYWMPFFAPCYSAIAFWCRKHGIRTLFICHNIAPHEKRPGDEPLTRLALLWVDRFIVLSESVADDLLRFRPNAVYRLTPHPVYDRFGPAVSRSEARRRLNIRDRMILFFGYIRPYKGLATLIEAMPMIADLPVHLTVAGEFYEGKKEIEDLIRGLGLSSRVTLIDRYLPNEEIPNYFCAADVVVLPYVSATQSGVVRLAHHYERPVVVTDVGGLAGMVEPGRTGFVAPPGNPKALATAIRQTLSKPLDFFGPHIRKAGQSATWEGLAQVVETLSDISTSAL